MAEAEKPKRNPKPRAAVDAAVAEVTVDTAAAELPAPDGMDDDDAVEEASQPEPPPAPPAPTVVAVQEPVAKVEEPKARSLLDLLYRRSPGRRRP